MPQGGRRFRAHSRRVISRRARSSRCFHCAQRARRSFVERLGTPLLALLALGMGVAVFSTAGPRALSGAWSDSVVPSTTSVESAPTPASASSWGVAPPTGAPTTIASAAPEVPVAPWSGAGPAVSVVPTEPAAAAPDHGAHSGAQGTVPTATVPVPLASPTTPVPCSIGHALIPSCGVLTGLYSDTAGGVPARQAQVGHAFNLVHLYKGTTDTFPTASDLAALGSDTALYVDWDTYYANGGRAKIRWRDIAAGEWNPMIDAEAAQLAAYGQPIMVSVMHDMELTNSNGAFGTPQDFVAAWRTVVMRMRADGATNVIWVWEMGGEQASNAVAYYPGNDVVDWIAWDPYNGGNCPRDPSGWGTFAQITASNYAFFASTAPYSAKPLMLGEFGTVEQSGNAAAKEGWFDSVPAQASAEPNLKALVYFDSSAGCNWAVDSSSASLLGFASMTAAGY